jgi:hypothetical protein
MHRQVTRTRTFPCRGHKALGYAMLTRPAGFAQKLKIQREIDSYVSLKIQEISPKSTYCAKPPPGEG